MVVKEDLCAWFKRLQPRKRIDYMCALLDLLLPLELRFIGTVLEDIAKKDFNFLRDAELKANIASNLENIDGDSDRSRGSFSLSNEAFRYKIHLSLALLHSNNTACANVIFNILENQSEYILRFLQNKEILEDVCSILSLACHHPAFQFYQRLHLGEVLKTVEARAQKMDDSEDNFQLPLPSSSARAYRPAASFNRPPSSHEYAEKAKIRNIQVRGWSKSKEEQQNKKGALVYDVLTTWSNGEPTQAFMKYKEFQDIQHKLVNKFPEWQAHRASIPELPAHRKYREEQKEGVSIINAYLNELLKAPAYVLECDILTQPLRSGKLVPPAVSMGNQGTISAYPYFQRVPLYQGAQVLECKYAPDPYRMSPYATYSYPSLTLAPVSPRASHLSSSTTSPTNSRPSSPASNPKANVNHSKRGKTGNQQNLVSEELAPAADPILQLLRLCDLEKYSDNLSCFTFDQLLAMSKEELGKAGLPTDAQFKLKSHLDQYKPQYINGLIERPGFSPMSDQLLPAQPIAVWPNPTQEAMLISGQPTSITHPPYHSVSSLTSPQSHTTAGECSPANSEVCSPSLSPALHQSDSPQNSPNVARGGTGVTVPSSSALPLKSGRVLQVDSSGSEDDRVPGVDGTEILVGNQGFARPQLSNSMPHISQSSGPPGFLDKKVNIMPNIHIPNAEPAIENSTPQGMVPTTTVAVTLVNGFMSDSNSFMPQNAPSRVLNPRAFKHAQPTHTAPARHQNIVNMPGLDLSNQTLHAMNKNGNGLNSIMPSPLHRHPFMMPPPIPVTQGSSLQSHPNLQANSNSAPNPSGAQPSMPPVANETGNGMPVFPLLYVAHPNLPGTIHPHRGIINTMANSSVVITTTQSSQNAPAPPHTSHSPSPVASVISSDQMQGGYVPGNGEPLVESRQDGSSTSPPNMAQLQGKAGPNSGTPSPPLSNKQTSNMNCDSAAPPVFTPPLQSYYTFSGHSNGIIAPMPPPMSYFHTSNPVYANGFNPDMYLHRFPAQISGGQVPIQLYGNSIHPQHMHTTNSSLSNSANSNSISISTNNGSVSKSGCSNCGQAGHKAVDCKENTMDSMTKPFSLNFNPNPKADPE